MNVLPAPGTQLHGRSLILARLVWTVVTLLAIILMVASFQLTLVVDLLDNMPELASQIDNAMARVFANNPLLGSSTIWGVAIAQLVAYLIVGGYLFWRKSADWLAILASIMLISTGVGFTAPGFVFLPVLRPAWHIPATLLQTILFAALISFLYLFPNGRFTPTWTRYTLIVWVALAASWLIWPQLNPHRAPTFLGLGIFIAFAWTGVIAQVQRYRQLTEPGERQQIKWVMGGFLATQSCFSLLILFSAMGISTRLEQTIPAAVYLINTLLGLSSILIPFTIAFAILRYRLWDIDLLINRTLVFGGLTLLVAAVYALLVGLLSGLFRAGNNVLLSILATGLIAILFDPLRRRLQQGVNRLMYGERDDPVAVLARLGERLENTVVPEAVLPALVETIGQTLKLPYVAVTVARKDEGRRQKDEAVAAYGRHMDKVISFLLVYQGQIVGQLLVAPRAPGEDFSPAEQRLLAQIAHQAAGVVHTFRLNQDLRRARERLVTAREEERRQMRRALHDGLGAQLASMTLKADATCRQLTGDPEMAATLLHELRADTQQAMHDIRALTRSLSTAGDEVSP